MQHFFKALLFSSAFLAAVSGYEVTTTGNYYQSGSTFNISCGNVAWTPTFVVSFYRDNDPKNIFFNSTAKDFKAPVTGVDKKNTTIIIKMDKNDGLNGVGCIAKDGKKADTKSTKPVSIPYVSGTPTLKHTPEKFKLNTTFTLTCEVQASVPVDTTFNHGSTMIAVLKNNKFAAGTPEKGLKVEQGPKDSKNTIMITPSLPANNGSYWCEYSFLGADGKNVTGFKSAEWKANGIESLTAQLMLIVVSVFSAVWARA